MLNTIKLNSGDSKDSKTIFSVQAVNVIVGPNNSGKSLLLREIQQFLKSDRHNQYLMVEDIDLKLLTPEKLEEKLKHRKRDNHNPHNYDHVAIYDDYGNSSMAIPVDTFRSCYFNPDNGNLDINRLIFRFIGGQSVLLLNGQTRLNSLSWKPFSTVPQPGLEHNSSVNKIIRDDTLYQKLQNYILDAFNVYPEISLNGSNARIVLSEDKIPELLRLSVKPEATEFLNNAQNDENTSDGRKAYIGIISEIISGNPDTILLDEPEAFLHPPLARKLGNIMSKLANEENKQLFVSSHSSNFIMGCVEANVPVNIIRLTYDGQKATSKLLDNESLARMMKNPLLRSTNVLDGIFYKNVIVTESDSDRVFYQEINYRLKEFKPEWYIEDCLFLNAQNKQTVGWITKELRNIGIPTVSIIDLDLIKDGGKMFTDYLRSVNIPENQHSGLCAYKNAIKELFPDIQQKNSVLKTKGIKYLNSGDKPLLQSFLNSLNIYGLFPVPNGELEAWLPEIPLDGHGNNWIIGKFDLMGDDPESDSYIKPNENDVWFFFKLIKEWFDNPDKLGM